MEFKEKLDSYISLAEDSLKVYNAHSDNNKPQSGLIDAMNYSLEAGGKRVRPVLVYSFCEMLGGDLRKAKAPAAAIEMIHTFSLIHDDLPAMDDDDFRRGRPSCHKAYGEAMAILAGDALSVLPFEIIADDNELDAAEKVRIISYLAKAVGRDGMIGGQVIDMENEERTDVDEANLRNMYRCKTGQLIAASCVMGCICAGADADVIRTAEEYAFRLGLAFQIIDDILDVTGTQENLGKPVGSDEEENKTTFVTLYGVARAQEIASAITSEAMTLLEQFDNSGFLKQLTEMLLKRTK
ncbi:MAG: polyprenyl synthetase family protein [Oscillospiraceae bacterium]|nr:polyprenyl synthetase family protein [Oscillospiraceae bacterium]